MSNDRGPYLTPSRALELERKIAELEGRLTARLDRLEQDLAAARGLALDVLRAQASALLSAIRDEVKK